MCLPTSPARACWWRRVAKGTADRRRLRPPPRPVLHVDHCRHRWSPARLFLRVNGVGTRLKALRLIRAVGRSSHHFAAPTSLGHCRPSMKPRCVITAAAWWPCLRHRVDWKPVSSERVKSGRVTRSIGLDRKPVRTSRWGGAVSHRAARRSSMTLARVTRWPLPRMKDGINIHRPLSDIRCRCGWKKESLATWRDSASPLVRRNRPSCHGEIRSATRNCALQPGSRAWQHCARSLRDHRSHS